MARTSSRARNVATRTSLELPEGSELVRFEGGRKESVDERRHRLRTEFLSFLVKDLLAYLVAFGVIVVAAIYCFSVLWARDVTDDDRRWATSVLGSMLTALVGFAFGKSMK
jgi:hypothetical protein